MLNTPETLAKQLPLSQRETFVALPSDLAIPLTTEQLNRLFPGKKLFVRDLVRLSAEAG